MDPTEYIRKEVSIEMRKANPDAEKLARFVHALALHQLAKCVRQPNAEDPDYHELNVGAAVYQQ